MINFLLVERTIKVPLDKVWTALNFYKSQGPFPVVTEKNGDPNFYGLGGRRTIKFGKIKALESLEKIDPPHSYTYAVLSGVPVKYYSGKVELFSRENGTEIKWSGKFVPKIPGIGWIISKMTKQHINIIINELERIGTNENQT